MELIIKHFTELSINELYDIIQARVDIFVVEQKCPYRELDDKDRNAYHIWLRDENGIIAYMRALDKGVAFEEASIGRIITVRRSQGFGAVIMREGIKFALGKYNTDTLKIMAQHYAKGFYEKFGFVQCSEPFDDDGIEHINMILTTNGGR